MFLFTFPSRINPKSEAAEKFGDMGGAYINCYIQFKCFEAAEKLARLLIRESGFIPGKRTGASALQKKHLKTEAEKQYYSEAIKYGYSLVFHLWPKDAADADTDDEQKDVRR